MTLRRMTLNLVTVDKAILIITKPIQNNSQINDNQHKRKRGRGTRNSINILLKQSSYYADCHFAFMMMCANMLTVIKLSVTMLSVVAPF